MQGFLWLLNSGDPLPFDLLAKNPKDCETTKQEWKSILSANDYSLSDPSVIPQLAKLLTVEEFDLRLATATALQRFHTPAAVIHLGKILDTPLVEKKLAIVAAKGLAEFANGRPMTTSGSIRTPADNFPHFDDKFPFRTYETDANSWPNPDVPGDDDRHISYWKAWWVSNSVRVAALAAQQP